MGEREDQLEELDDAELGQCQWFALCPNDATHTRSHPILGEVPICDRCEAFVAGLE